jgi:predicted metal-dependent phosphoesterase TrpH
MEQPSLDDLRLDHDLVDLHFHTLWSDGLATPMQALHRARELRIKLAITDHNKIEGLLQAWQLAGDEAAKWLLPGIEITTAERIHLLVYFRRPEHLRDFFLRAVKPWRPKGATATTPINRPVGHLLEELRAWPHFTAAAHPFAFAKNGWMTVRQQHQHIGALLDDLDAVEVLNGQEIDAGNASSEDLASLRGLGRVAGSDGHSLGELGNVLAAVPRGADLFDALRDGAMTPIDRRPPGLWRRVVGQAPKAVYYAAKPGRMVWRITQNTDGDGPVTRDGLRLEHPLPDPPR